MPQLEILVIDRTELSSKLNFITFLIDLENLQIYNIKLIDIPSLYLIKNLKYLSIMGYKKLNNFSFLTSIFQIKSLAIEIFYPSQISHSHLTHFRNLKNLEITDCTSTFDLLILEKENF